MILKYVFFGAGILITFCRRAFRLVVAVDVVVFVAAIVDDVVLVVRFDACVVADITVAFPGVSGFLLEAVDVVFDVLGV